MVYIIGEECVQCNTPFCSSCCPVGAIEADSGKKRINPKICINCGVCGISCQKEAIRKLDGTRIRFIPKEERPWAVVNSEFCSGCGKCIEVCPFNCLEMVADKNNVYFTIAENIRSQDCVACRLCVEICSDKYAIQICWPDGSISKNFNKDGQGNPIKLSGAFTVISDW